MTVLDTVFFALQEKFHYTGEVTQSLVSDDEMPQENSPVSSYDAAVEKSQANVLKLHLANAKAILENLYVYGKGFRNCSQHFGAVSGRDNANPVNRSQKQSAVLQESGAFVVSGTLLHNRDFCPCIADCKPYQTLGGKQSKNRAYQSK